MILQYQCFLVLSCLRISHGKEKENHETETQGPQHTVNCAEQYFLAFPRILGFCEKILRTKFSLFAFTNNWPVTQEQLVPYSNMHAVQAIHTKVQMLTHGACN
jgi:hypothetical protein